MSFERRLFFDAGPKASANIAKLEPEDERARAGQQRELIHTGVDRGCDPCEDRQERCRHEREYAEAQAEDDAHEGAGDKADRHSWTLLFKGEREPTLLTNSCPRPV